jgi:hypothetical protein
VCHPTLPQAPHPHTALKSNNPRCLPHSQTGTSKRYRGCCPDRRRVCTQNLRCAVTFPGTRMQLPLHQTARTNEHVCTPVRLLCPAATLHRAVARAALDQRFTLSAVPTCQHADAPTSPKRNGPEICAAASFVPWQRLLYRLCVPSCRSCSQMPCLLRADPAVPQCCPWQSPQRAWALGVLLIAPRALRDDAMQGR